MYCLLHFNVKILYALTSCVNHGHGKLFLAFCDQERGGGANCPLPNISSHKYNFKSILT